MGDELGRDAFRGALVEPEHVHISALAGVEPCPVLGVFDDAVLGHHRGDRLHHVGPHPNAVPL
jgi:hypothetical protein